MKINNPGVGTMLLRIGYFFANRYTPLGKREPENGSLGRAINACLGFAGPDAYCRLRDLYGAYVKEAKRLGINPTERDTSPLGKDLGLQLPEFTQKQLEALPRELAMRIVMTGKAFKAAEQKTRQISCFAHACQ